MGSKQEEAFAIFKLHLYKAPVLQIFNLPLGTIWKLHTDASAVAIGAVLLEKRPTDTGFHHVEFFSQTLGQAQQAYSDTDREMLAIIESLRYWRGYLAGESFVVCTNHKPLENFFSQPNLSAR